MQQSLHVILSDHERDLERVCHELHKWQSLYEVKYREWQFVSVNKSRVADVFSRVLAQLEQDLIANQMLYLQMDARNAFCRAFADQFVAPLITNVPSVTEGSQLPEYLSKLHGELKSKLVPQFDRVSKELAQKFGVWHVAIYDTVTRHLTREYSQVFEEVVGAHQQFRVNFLAV